MVNSTVRTRRTVTRTNSNGSLRLGPVKLALGGIGCLGLLFVGVAFYAASAAFWGWAFMLIHGAAVGKGTPGYWTQAWGYRDALIPWGLLAPFMLG